jgi:alpha-tubulin suppressor-like RCC1 family protein
MEGAMTMLSRRRHLTALAACLAAAAAVLVVPSPAAGTKPPERTVRSWGYNVDGQLGDGTTTDQDAPVLVGYSLPAGVTVAQLATGRFHSLALLSTGTVLAWGDNTYGQLGDGTTTSSDTPMVVLMPAGYTVTAIAAGYTDSFALTSTGSVYAWGSDEWCEIGQPSKPFKPNHPNPVEVELPAGVTATAVAAANRTGFALTTSGQVYSWGDNEDGALGQDNPENSCLEAPAPVWLPDGDTATAISGGYDTGYAITDTGAVLAWGDNEKAQTGSGVQPSVMDAAYVPVDVVIPAGTTVVAVASGFGHAAALTSDGHVLTWGGNDFGELGDGASGGYSDVPVQVDLPAGALVGQLSTGPTAYHMLASVFVYVP